MRQQIVQANLSGAAFDGVGAGPWMVAAGIEHRAEQVSVGSDPLSQGNAFFTANQQSWEGRREVSEGFLELNAPLLDDVRFAERLEANLAGRRTHYSTSGTVGTWKFGLNYKPVSEFRIRGTISHDIRAPAQSEMFTRGQQTVQAFSDPFNGGVRVPNVWVVVQGNESLRPEVADTTTLGAVYQPDWIPGLSLSVDRFDIKLKDAIRSLSGQAVVDQCFEGFSQVCEQIERDADGTISRINNTNFNLDLLRLTGWDAEARYFRNVHGGVLGFRAYVSYLERLALKDFENNEVDRAGETSTPRWRALASVSYQRWPLSAFLQSRYIGSNRQSNTRTPAQANFNSVPSAIYLDGQVGYAFGDRWTVALNVQNLLDKQPLFAPEQGAYYNPTDSSVYDQVGRAYRLSIGYEF